MSNKLINTEKRFALCTLGCKVNQEESVALGNVFKEQGWRRVAFEDEADVYIVNSCTVTHLADRKSRQMLRRAVRTNPQALVVATGCYAQVGKEEISDIEGVDLIVGTNDRYRLFAYVQRHLGEKQQPPQVYVTPTAEVKDFKNMGNLNNDTARERAFLKIEDGCSQFCSYCIIPYARGPVRSRPLSDILAEARELVAKGYQEIVLTGIHTGAYGTDLEDGSSLAAVAAALAAIPGLHRLRLGSVEPQEVTNRLIQVIAENPNICHHLHIPLQACDDEIIKKMNRHYTVDFYADLLANIRKNLDNAAVTTDLIVGFPGETPEIFERSLKRLAELKFADMHIFPYSRRQGTPAAVLPNQISPEVKSAEVKVVSALRDEMKLAFWQEQVGRKLEILTEQEIFLGDKAYMTGHSPNYLPLAVAAAESGRLAPGQIYQLKICEIKGNYLIGKII
ncbi:MAG: tRNA (N(6)-L-threonylcarbamoyladenosine(37)-C(2))-methylthiotransferase MtaB [Bacillota bacterium]|jgi:threonylcarbamoyladenosine tRNA methylthiotransferase MtaB